MGYHQPATGQTSCAPCSTGRYSNATGMTESRCIPCAYGRFNNVTGAAACLECARGTFSKMGARECAFSPSNCPAGTYHFKHIVRTLKNITLVGDEKIPERYYLAGVGSSSGSVENATANSSTSNNTGTSSSSPSPSSLSQQNQNQTSSLHRQPNTSASAPLEASSASAVPNKIISINWTLSSAADEAAGRIYSKDGADEARGIDRQASAGDTLRFVWQDDAAAEPPHNVYRLVGEKAFHTCSFENATLIGASSPVFFNISAGPVSSVNNTLEPLFFACSVGDHCSNSSLKVRITLRADRRRALQQNENTSSA